MFGYNEISVDLLTSTPVFASLALLVSAALAVYLYLRTNPPLPRSQRVLLGAIRLVALVALFAALFQPVIRYHREFQRPQRVTVIRDHSGSMDRIESGMPRLNRMDSLLSSASFATLAKDVDITAHYFGGNLVADAAAVDRDQTALGNVLDQLRQTELERPSDYWILFSDGRWNSGREPASYAGTGGVPIIAVDMSAGNGNFDLALTEIDFNPVVFVGQKTEIITGLAWQGALGRQITVDLRDSTRVLAKDRLAVTQEIGRSKIKLEYIPTEPGQKILQVNVLPMPDEVTDDNNRRSIAVKVLKSRLSILLVSSHPDYEVGFLKRLLTQSGKYDVELKVTGSRSGNLGGKFPSRQAELNRYDLIILHDPDPAGLAAYQEIIRSYLAERGGALWVLMGEQFASQTPQPWFNDLLPFHPSRTVPLRQAQFHARPVEANLFHPSLRLAESQSAVREVWSQLPPFHSLVTCDVIGNDAVILAQAVLDGVPKVRWPVLGSRRLGPGKIFASAALPFWTWGFMNLGLGEQAGHYGTFLEGVTSWLTVRDDFDPIRIQPTRDVFARGETVTFEGSAFDLGFRPLPGVTGLVRLVSDDGSDTVETDLIGLGDGKYRARFFNLSPAKYHYTGTFEKDNRQLKESEGDILVEPFSLEEYDPSGDPATLTAVARLSGGDYFTYQQFDRALAAIDTRPVMANLSGEVTIFNKLWVLLVIIGALCVEWLLRKIWQLI